MPSDILDVDTFYMLRLIHAKISTNQRTTLKMSVLLGKNRIEILFNQYRLGLG